MKKTLRDIIVMILVFILGFGGGWFAFQLQREKNAEAVENADSEGFDLRLPGEVEKRIVTKDEVEAKLLEIGELATYAGEYTVSKSADYTRHVLDNIPVPGTTNTINLTCKGIVKVGYDVKEITPTVDVESQKIYIALPAASLLDNYVIWDSVEYAESNNILNPIDFAQYETLIGEIEQEGLTQTEEQGIYASAEDNAKTLIRNFLAGFEDYEIIFL